MTAKMERTADCFRVAAVICGLLGLLMGLGMGMAGDHRLWEVDPEAGTMGVLAGTGSENLVDGPAREALLAQPSGLAADGPRLWF
ncbi:MAG: hypothetical protein ACK4YX_11890, partial [Rhabdaerophilum calidifontis]